MAGGVFDGEGYAELKAALVFNGSLSLEPYVGLVMSASGRHRYAGTVSTLDPATQRGEVRGVSIDFSGAMFPGGDPFFVPQTFGWAIECFTGRYRNYQSLRG